MTQISMEILLRTVEISPALGVTPPSRRLLHNSMRCAPPRSAAIADSTESAQTSRITESLIYPLLPSVRVRDLPEAGAPADREPLENIVQTELYLSFRRTHATYPTPVVVRRRSREVGYRIIRIPVTDQIEDIEEVGAETDHLLLRYMKVFKQ